MEEINIPPTDHAIRMRPWFIGSLLILMGIVIGKFVISDYWGAISLFFVVLMGVLVLTGDHGISATNALFYSVMAMISAIFDVISCMLYFQHSKYKAFEHNAPSIVITAQLIFICSPIFLFISSAISYSIFSDCQSRMEELMPPMRGGRGFDDGFGGPYGGMGNQPMPRQQPRGPGGQPQPGQGQPGIQPFVGTGHRLGA